MTRTPAKTKDSVPPPPPVNTPNIRPASAASAASSEALPPPPGGRTAAVGSNELAMLQAKLVTLNVQHEDVDEGVEGESGIDISKDFNEQDEAEDREDDEDDDDEFDEMEEGDDDVGLDLSKEGMRCVLKLQQLQERRDELAEQYKQERSALEIKYRDLYAPVYQQRADVIAGKVDVSDIEVPGFEDDDDDEEEEEAVPEDEKGLRNFWMQAMLHHEALADIIQEDDLECLVSLNDVRCVEKDNMMGFELQFHFAKNEFFTGEPGEDANNNIILRKKYDTANILDQGESVLENVTGHDIHWKKDKNLCETVITKKIRRKSGRNKGEVKVVRQVETKESFFKFFLPPIMYEHEEGEEDEETHYEFNYEMDYEIALIFRNHIVPNAVHWFTGDAVAEEEEEDGEGDEEEDEEDEEGDDEYDGEGEDGEGDDEAVDEGTGAILAQGSVQAQGQPTAGGENPECKQS